MKELFWSSATKLYRFWYRFFEKLLKSTPTKANLIPTIGTAASGTLIIPEKRELLQVIDEEDNSQPQSEFKSLKSVVTKHFSKSYPATTTPSNETTDQAPATVAVRVRSTPLYLQPTKEFDSVITTIWYGTILRVHQEVGNWVSVEHNSQNGWVHRDDVTPHVAQTKPYFVIKEYCGPESENTKRLRLTITDVFFAGEATLPLTSEEFVYYKLFSRGIALPNIDARPRVAGTWQNHFKGMTGVHISIRPKTGTVMEYLRDSDQGHLAYVEAVFPDESISLSEIGIPEDGYYSERTLSKEVWQALKPVFIQFS